MKKFVNYKTYTVFLINLIIFSLYFVMGEVCYVIFAVNALNELYDNYLKKSRTNKVFQISLGLMLPLYQIQSKLTIAFIFVILILSLIRAIETYEKSTSSKTRYSNQHLPLADDQLKSFSWLEITQHDQKYDCWIVIDSKVYDVTDFVKKHPGGSIIYDGAGGENTQMWQSMHPSSLIKQGVPRKYLVGSVKNYHDFYDFQSNFYMNIKKQVEQKVKKHRDDFVLYFKGAVIFCAYIYSMYYYQVYNTIFGAFIAGFAASQVGLNIMHDGNHIAFSSNNILNYITGYMLDLTFSTSVVFRRSHGFGHHGCTNHYELDRAFDTTYPFIRLHSLQEHKPYHKYQHIYTWFLYGMTNWGDLFGTFDEIFFMSNYPTRVGFTSLTQVIMAVIVKVWWVILMLFIPWYNFGFVNAFQCCFMHMTFHSYGYVLFFAVNHWVADVQFSDNESVANSNWGELQIISSVNFSLQNNWMFHFCGGLNYQIEHHLFPSYSHTTLPQIAEIIQQESKKNKLSYFVYPSFWKALQAHYYYLKQLGEKE